MRKSQYLGWLVGLIAVLAQSAFAADVTAGRTADQSGKPGVISVMTTTETVRIVAVDQAKRTVKIKTSDGEVGTYQVSKEVRNLAQVKRGDVLKAKEVEKLSIQVKRSRAKPTASHSYIMTRAPKGAKPGVVATERIKVTGRVQLVLYKERRVAITGPLGRTMTFDVARDVTNLNQLKPGDFVVAYYTDTISMQVRTPQK